VKSQDNFRGRVRYWIKPSPPDIRSLFSQQGNQSASPADAEEPPNPALRTRESHPISKLSMKEIDGIAPKMDYRYQKQILEMRDSITVPVIREPSGAMPPPHRERDIDGSPAANTRPSGRHTEASDNPSTFDDTTTTVHTSTLPAEACQTFSECSIWLDSFQDDYFVRETQCHHLYYAHCLEWWLAKYRARCPLCQKDLKASRASKPP
jgi:hypothetical protein